MCDGGRHFNNNEVKENCTKWGIKQHVTPAYSPWVNGLVEGTNKLLLYVLARLCAPEVGEDGWQAAEWDKLPKTWPDHFQEAIHILNWRILPALKFSPKELMLGLVVNTANTPLEASASVLTPSDIDKHLTYTAQQRLDGYAEAIHHAIRRKATFDKKVLKSRGGVVTFRKGQLVQAYRSDLMNMLSTDRKLQPTWSGPYRIREQVLNSYKLENLDGTPRAGEYSARRLCAFTPREGTELGRIQRELEERIAEEEGRDDERDMMIYREDPIRERVSEPMNAEEPEMQDAGDEVGIGEFGDPEGENCDFASEVAEDDIASDGDMGGDPLAEEEENSSIGSRVAGRRGRRRAECGVWRRG